MQAQVNPREPEFPVADIFINRWSPRAFSGEQITKEQLMSLFEAAKWAPSSYNNQPWRFVYALKGTPHWNNFFNLLVDFNKQWAQNAGALVLVISYRRFEFNKKFARTHAFDTGSAWQNLALQASLNGLIVHGMEGFDYNKARQMLGLNEDYEIHAMIAVGRPGQKESLPKDLQKSEVPSTRKSIKEFAFEGKIPNISNNQRNKKQQNSKIQNTSEKTKNPSQNQIAQNQNSKQQNKNQK